MESAVQAQNELGFPLTKEERSAIGKHLHEVRWKKKGHPFNKEAQLWNYLYKCDHLNAEKEGHKDVVLKHTQ